MSHYRGNGGTSQGRIRACFDAVQSGAFHKWVSGVATTWL